MILVLLKITSVGFPVFPGFLLTLSCYKQFIHQPELSCSCARRRAAIDPRLPRATNQLLIKSSLGASDYTMVKRVGVVPSSTSVLVGPTADVSSQNVHGLNASELPDHVYEVDLSALAMRQYQIACGCGVNMMTNGVCKHAWIAITGA
eukprot:6197549-Pleurochrysis_carterae.AAC.1